MSGADTLSPFSLCSTISVRAISPYSTLVETLILQILSDKIIFQIENVEATITLLTYYVNRCFDFAGQFTYLAFHSLDLDSRYAVKIKKIPTNKIISSHW